MLDRVEGWSPGPVESHHHEHQALSVEGSTTEEKGKHDNDWWQHCISILYFYTKVQM